MTIATIDQRVFRPIWALAVAVAVAAVLLAGAFVAGRTSAPTRTLRSAVTVPVAPGSPALDGCRFGRPC